MKKLLWALVLLVLFACPAQTSQGDTYTVVILFEVTAKEDVISELVKILMTEFETPLVAQFEDSPGVVVCSDPETCRLVDGKIIVEIGGERTEI